MVNPTRLHLARLRRGYTKSHLAKLTGLSARSITNYEKGLQNPTEETLATLAEAMAFPVEFFGQPDLEAIAEAAASFRSLTSMTAAKRDQALGAGTLALVIDEWIEGRFSRPAPDVPEVDDETPEAAAEIVRAEWGLGTKPIKNMIHLLELHGIRVFSLAEAGRSVDAFSFWRDQRPYVMLNTQKSAEHSRFDAAHELGHLVLHRTGERGRDAERDANQFASAFLMPRPAILAAGLAHATLPTLVTRKAEWKVSVVALIYRLHALGILTDWQYRSLYIAASKKGYRSQEPRPAQRETSQVLDKVLDYLRAQGITRRDVARSLHLEVEDFDRLVFGLVMLAQDGGSPSGPSSSGARPHLRVVE